MSEDVPLKRCSRCKQFNPATLDYFHRYKGGLHSQCKECRCPPKPIDLIHQGQKRCPKCEEWKPATAEYFHRNNQKRDGLYPRCKKCNTKPPKVSDVPEGYKRCYTCKCNFLATSEFFYSHKSKRGGLEGRCKACARKAAKAYGSHNKERDGIEVSAVRPLEKRCPKCKTLSPATTEFFHSNKAAKDGLTGDCKVCIYKRMQEYYKSPGMQEQAVRRSANRRARKMAVPGIHTAVQIHEQYKRQKGKCYYCQQKVRWGEHHVDHTFPLSREGASNDISYLVITCKFCNLSKGDRYPWEWPEGGRLL